MKDINSFKNVRSIKGCWHILKLTGSIRFQNVVEDVDDAWALAWSKNILDRPLLYRNKHISELTLSFLDLSIYLINSLKWLQKTWNHPRLQRRVSRLTRALQIHIVWKSLAWVRRNCTLFIIPLFLFFIVFFMVNSYQSVPDQVRTYFFVVSFKKLKICSPKYLGSP